MVDYARGLSFLSPGSDAFYPSQPIITGGRFILGRDGSDTIALYDPAGNPFISQSDILSQSDAALADILQGEFPGERIPRNWSDTFVLGDWQKPYYVNPLPSNFGINEALYILNFQPQLDTVKLFGTQENYQLINIPNVGQGLFWRSQSTPSFDTSSLQQLASSRLMRSLANVDLSSPETTASSTPTPIQPPVNNLLMETSYWEDKNVPDLIGVFLDNAQLREQGFPAIPSLDLGSSYFNYLGSSPPPLGEEFGKIRQEGTSGHDVTISPAVSTATDANGNVYLASATTGSLGGANAGLSDVWVTKYDSNGERIFAKQYGSSGEELTSRIASDNAGNFYVAGYSRGSFGAANPEGNTDAFLAKYNSNGDQQWIQQFGSGFQSSFGLDIDANGNAYISGIAGKFVSIGPDQTVFLEDAFVAKYDTNGNQQFYNQFGSAPPGSQESYGAAVDDNGNLFATGWTSGNIDPSLSGRIGTYDTWISKHDTDGNLQWIKQFGTTDFEFAWGVDTDSQGNVYATGWTLGNLGGENAGSYDSWLAKYDTNGVQQWIKQFGTGGDDEALGITIDQFDNIFLGGFTNANFAATNKGRFDAWVSRFDVNGNQIWNQQFGTSELDYATQLSTDSFGHVFVAGLTEGSLGAVNAGSVDAWLAKLDVNTGKVLDFQPQPVMEPSSSVGLLLTFCLTAIAKKMRAK